MTPLPERREALLALADRCEKATGHSLDLDHEIGRALSENGNYAYRPYTFSLDAAMTLVPDEWTAWQLRSRGRKTRFVATLARLIDDIENDYDEQEVVSHAATPALALCAAALHARSQTQGGEGE